MAVTRGKLKEWRESQHDLLHISQISCRSYRKYQIRPLHGQDCLLDAYNRLCNIGGV